GPSCVLAAGAGAGPGDGAVVVGGQGPVAEGFGAVPAAAGCVQVGGCGGAVGVDVVEVLTGDDGGRSTGDAQGDVTQRDERAHQRGRVVQLGGDASEVAVGVDEREPDPRAVTEQVRDRVRGEWVAGAGDRRGATVGG